ncbi:MAG: metallophosphoesterase family protein [Oscillospiraceae bacterium]|nr:metallophosphoesterase family protein [Oscillospiraceae bacterium]
MKKSLSLMLALVLCIGALLIPAGAADVNGNGKLQFNKDGSFRILQISDIQDGPALHPIVKDFIRDAVKEADPDLVVLTGDNIGGPSCGIGVDAIDTPFVKIAIDKYMSIFEEAGVPVAMVFGNHDDQNIAVSKEEQMEMYQSYSCFIGNDDNSELYGCGTYNLPIYSSDGSKIAYNLWMIDSNAFDEVNGGYDYVHQDQLDWYVKTSNELKAQNGGNPVHSMMFQHIIVPEIYDALNEVPAGTEGAVERDGKYYVLNPENTVSGKLNEAPCPSKTNSGQFETLIQQDDVVAMFFGHDHVNTFRVNYKGIDLVNTPGVTFNSYGNDCRGARIIDINENDTSYNTSIIFYKELYKGDEAAEQRFIAFGSENEFLDRVSAFFKYLFLKAVSIISL